MTWGDSSSLFTFSTAQQYGVALKTAVNQTYPFSRLRQKGAVPIFLQVSFIFIVCNDKKIKKKTNNNTFKRTR